MFRRILIANRGEIACRVIRTARRLGIGTVAVHSEADARALHVEMADEAVCIGPPAPAESYLRGDAIIEAALATGAEAIHPGYGFLSENPDFVEAVERAGLVFIGPSAEAIRAMGLKDAAKRLMEEAGVPVVPGWHGDNQDPEHLAGAAEAIGWPVLIKAVAGGGGKGMRRVDRAEDFPAALEAARSEAEKAFGDGRVLIEKFIARPRHIEVQIFGDGRRAVHLFERDCSAQRRHQKVIEEAPAPGMTAEMRDAMGQAAVRAAEAIGYAGAGTVEFIVDASEGLRPDRFWFMEMNTRLQVEHPVTEAVTGIDLVEWQLRVAAGEELPLTQERITLRGHAVEARLYAERPEAGFLPATGRIAHLSFPDDVRIETGVRAGDEISPWYDPMIAKIITHGPNREIALQRMALTLEETEIAGTATNLAFLSRLVGLPAFRAGDLDTAIIDRHLEALVRAAAPTDAEIALAALAAAGLERAAMLADPLLGFHLWQPLVQTVPLLRQEEGKGEERIEVRIATLGPGRHRVEIDGKRLTLEHDAGGWRIDGAKTALRVRRAGGEVAVFGGTNPVFTLPDPLARGDDAEGADGTILAPMPGLVRQIAVAPGARVTRGQRLAVLEAMKMEHSLTAPFDGVVAAVLAEEGVQIEAGAPILVLEEEGEAAA